MQTLTDSQVKNYSEAYAVTQKKNEKHFLFIKMKYRIEGIKKKGDKITKLEN